jgi:hypothetical protein
MPTTKPLMTALRNDGVASLHQRFQTNDYHHLLANVSNGRWTHKLQKGSTEREKTSKCNILCLGLAHEMIDRLLTSSIDRYTNKS